MSVTIFLKEPRAKDDAFVVVAPRVGARGNKADADDADAPRGSVGFETDERFVSMSPFLPLLPLRERASVVSMRWVAPCVPSTIFLL